MDSMNGSFFYTKVVKYMIARDMLRSGASVTAGVSGGADSVALLLVLCKLREEYDLKLSVVHVDHGLRPEAHSEAEYVKRLCETLDVPFHLKEADIRAEALKRGVGTEEAGRQVRYEAFNEVTPEGGFIAVAHNMNDLSETMLFHLFRGTGPKGLAGIAPVRGNVIRPLLCVTRAEIEEFLREQNVTYVTDSSNLEDDYTRNRIRHNIIPVIERDVEKQAVSHMFETAEQLRRLNDFAGGFAAEVFDRIASVDGEKVSFSLEGYKEQHDYIRSLLVRMAIDRLVPGNRDITSVHIRLVDELSLLANKEIDLPYDLKAYTRYGFLYIKKKGPEAKEPGSKAVTLNIPGETKVPGVGTFSCRIVPREKITEISRNEYTKCIDYDKITAPLLIRNRLSGDMISVTKTGSKKLKDFFIDQKTDRDQRDSIPLVAMDSDIVWVIGLRLSEGFKVTEATKQVLIIDHNKEEIC